MTLRPSTEIHEPRWLAAHPRLVCVLGALDVDMVGNVNSERAGATLVSGKGGAPDFASAAATVEKKAGQAFLDKAAAEKGATRTASGMIIMTVKAGNGASPKATDRVKVHYQGALTDGTVFDSSVQRNEPLTLSLGAVIKCWTEGVPMMKVGGKSKLVCPADLAYGDRGAPPRIKPGTTLVFDVELLDIVKEAK